MEKELVGKITHFFSKINVAVVELTSELNVGDKISIEGASTNFTQAVDSMQVDHASVKSASVGDSVGMKVKSKVHENDQVFKIVE
ncbi:MAG: translation elongation factor-like protein [Candidatus Micrarchaeota archaeon]